MNGVLIDLIGVYNSYTEWLFISLLSSKMKFLTTNFVKCSIKSCDSSSDSFPLKYQNCNLVQEEQEFQPEFIANILDRLEWSAILKVAADVSTSIIYP